MDKSFVTLVIVAAVVQYGAQTDAMQARAAHPYKEECFTGLGCFNNSAPFDNANGRLPAPPGNVSVQLDMYTRATRTNFESLSFASTSSSTLDPSKPTKVVIHGWQNTATTQWVIDTKDALLNKGDFNVLVVGWGKGAHGLDYFAAAANVRLVATELKLLLANLEKTGLDMGDVHLIGHSLGAHIAGMVGTMFGGRIARISGMDPASPSFEHHSDAVRLDKTDAKFVDVMHTDGNGTDITQGGYGLMQESGHVDFYVNGGTGHQPGCHDGLSGIFDIIGIGKKRNLLDDLAKGFTCSHARAHDYYLESIVSSCVFMGYPCSSWEEFKKGHCLDCSKGGCVKAGYPTQAPSSGKKYFMTTSKSPFCGVHYRLYLDVHDSVVARTDGTLYVALVGSAGETAFTMATTENAHMYGSTVVNKVVLFNKDVGDVSAIKVKYVKARHGLASTAIASVSVVSADSGKTFTSCQGKYQLTSDQANSLNAQLVDSSTASSCFDPSVFA